MLTIGKMRHNFRLLLWGDGEGVRDGLSLRGIVHESGTDATERSNDEDL